MRKITMKDQVLQFVESKETATFTDIQRFIVDTKFGEGTYGSRMVNDWVWDKVTQKFTKQLVRRNPWRGYFCAAFSIGYFNRTEKKYQPGGYFLRGENRLVKGSDGKYSVIRNSK
jgi:hypothetical protein